MCRGLCGYLLADAPASTSSSSQPPSQPLCLCSLKAANLLLAGKVTDDSLTRPGLLKLADLGTCTELDAAGLAINQIATRCRGTLPFMVSSSALLVLAAAAAAAARALTTSERRRQSC